ncbi:MAG: DNA polymerase III subunit delta [Termitinemataceae bacterium]|nr:MAG: DNA polymerase III subunit delta [Termitinemataceae bacterium]
MSNGVCYIFAGEEIGERQDEIEKIRKSIKDKYGTPPEEVSFYASETPASAIVSQLLNGSLFCDARLFFIKNADQIKKDEAAMYASYIKSPMEDTTLIFVTEQRNIDKKIEDAVVSFGKNFKHIFWELSEDQKEVWVRNFFKRKNFFIDNDGVDAVLELVENNTDALRRECSALSLFYSGANAKKTITAADIEALLSKTRSESAFTLFDALCEANYTKCLSLTRTLLASGNNPISIFAGLNWCFKRFRDYCILQANGMLNDFELRKAGITTKKNQNSYRLCAKNFGTNNCDKLIALCAEYDLEARKNDTNLQQILMDMFLHKVFGLERTASVIGQSISPYL